MEGKKEQKFRFNIEANRVAYLNKIYMIATCMMWVLFLLYSWLKLSWKVINPIVVYVNTVLVAAIVIINFIIFFKDKGSKKVYRLVLIQAGIETLIIGALIPSSFVIRTLIASPRFHSCTCQAKRRLPKLTLPFHFYCKPSLR